MRVTLIVALVLLSAQLLQWQPACAFTTVPLTNANMDTFTNGVADDFTSFESGNFFPPVVFYECTDVFDTPFASQGISDIDTMAPLGMEFAAGLYRQITTTPGKVYLFSGYQDLFEESYGVPPARRYAHFFGLGFDGSTTPPEPFGMGNVSWMGPGIWYWNDFVGSSTRVGGMHRCLAAGEATGPLTTLWTGLFTDASAQTPINQTVFLIDTHSLYEFDFPVHSSISNADFSLVDDLTPGFDPADINRISLPSDWVPVGGGIGQKESYYTETDGAHSGPYGLRIFNHRGILKRGVMQKVAFPQDKDYAVFSAYIRSNLYIGAFGYVGIDPTGGSDINSSDIVWQPYTNYSGAWQQVSCQAPRKSGIVTLFLMSTSEELYTNYQRPVDFDTLSLSFYEDTSPCDTFSVNAASPQTLTHNLQVTLSPLPQDAESGIDHLEFAVGTTSGAGDVCPFTPTDQFAETINAYGFDLTPGTGYYVSIKAVNGAGLARVATSNEIICSPKTNACSFNGPVHLSQTAFSADSPKIAAAPDDTLHVTWRESDNAYPLGTDAKVMHTSGYGTEWDYAEEVSTQSDCWWPDITCNGTNTYITYTSGRDTNSNDLYISQLVSGVFNEELVSANVAHLARLASANTLGPVIASFTNPSGTPDSNQPTFMYKDTGIWTDETVPPADLSSDSARIALAAFGDTVHIVYGTADGLYYTSRDSGGAYTTPVMLTAESDRADIAVGSTGDIHILFETSDGLWYTYSSDGIDFNLPVFISDGTSGTLTAHSDRIHLVYIAPTGNQNSNGTDYIRPIHMYKDPDGFSAPSFITDETCTSIHEMLATHDLAVDSAGELHLVIAQNPHDRGWQQTTFEGYYWIDYYTTGTITVTQNSILAARNWGDDAPAAEFGYPASKIVALTDKEITAIGTFPYEVDTGTGLEWQSVPFATVSEPDRTSAITVIAGDAQASPYASIGLAIGDLVDINGVITTIGGQRMIGNLASDGTVSHSSISYQSVSPTPLTPFFMQIEDLAGSDLGPTPGATGAYGLNNVGVLVKIAGEVVAEGLDGRLEQVLYVDDGSETPCGAHTGCKVYAPGTAAETGDYVIVEGISSLEEYDPTPGVPGDESLIRVVIPRTPAHIFIEVDN